MSERSKAGDEPAFPVPVAVGPAGDVYSTFDVTGGTVPGLTKREAFAMAALTGLCANPNLRQDVRYGALAVEIANALIAEFERTKP